MGMLRSASSMEPNREMLRPNWWPPMKSKSGRCLRRGGRTGQSPSLFLKSSHTGGSASRPKLKLLTLTSGGGWKKGFGLGGGEEGALQRTPRGARGGRTGQVSGWEGRLGIGGTNCGFGSNLGFGGTVRAGIWGLAGAGGTKPRTVSSRYTGLQKRGKVTFWSPG